MPQGQDFEITIDSELYEPSDRTLTANALLTLAGLDTGEYYLIEIKGKHQDSLEGQGDKDVHLHPGSKFISVYTGATQVAFGSEDEVKTLTGAARFAAELRAFGYEVSILPDEHLHFPYTVPVGKYVGKELDMGFVVPSDFPLSPPHGPHMSEKIHPVQSGGTHPHGGIHDSASGHSVHFGPGWQHWSRPHPKWVQGDRSVARYMAFVCSLWATQ